MTGQPTKGQFDVDRTLVWTTLRDSENLISCSGPDREANAALFIRAQHMDKLVEAAELALEYWGHRQQRYKNRHPTWVRQTRDILAKIKGEAK